MTDEKQFLFTVPLETPLKLHDAISLLSFLSDGIEAICDAHPEMKAFHSAIEILRIVGGNLKDIHDKIEIYTTEIAGKTEQAS